MTKIEGVIPAIRNLKDFEQALQTKHKWIVILEVRLGQLRSVVNYAKRANKKVLLHIDLVQGLKADEYGVEFVLEDITVDDVVVRRGSLSELAKKRGVLAVQRMFLLDSLSLKTDVRISSRYETDYIEVLPGKLPEVIKAISANTAIPIIAGGLINTEADRKSTRLNSSHVSISYA